MSSGPGFESAAVLPMTPANPVEGVAFCPLAIRVPEAPSSATPANCRRDSRFFLFTSSMVFDMNRRCQAWKRGNGGSSHCCPVVRKQSENSMKRHRLRYTSEGRGAILSRHLINLSFSRSPRTVCREQRRRCLTPPVPDCTRTRSAARLSVQSTRTAGDTNR